MPCVFDISQVRGLCASLTLLTAHTCHDWSSSITTVVWVIDHWGLHCDFAGVILVLHWLSSFDSCLQDQIQAKASVPSGISLAPRTSRHLLYGGFKPAQQPQAAPKAVSKPKVVKTAQDQQRPRTQPVAEGIFSACESNALYCDMFRIVLQLRK